MKIIDKIIRVQVCEDILLELCQRTNASIRISLSGRNVFYVVMLQRLINTVLWLASLTALYEYREKAKRKKELRESLLRWAEISEGVFMKGEWDECSLLHSFGDKLARELREAADYIK